jgi:cystathionine beta-lyase/cystathionine gamma-synthase
MPDKTHHLATRLIHAGEPNPRIAGAVSMPVFQTSTYLYAGEECYDAVRYIRLNNTPNHLALAEKLASLEGAESALVSTSGMAAIAGTLLTLLSTGDRLIAQDTLYGGTHALLSEELPALGIEVVWVSGEDPEEWRASVNDRTRAFYCESMTNPLLQVADLESIVAFCREQGLVSVIDNTFPSPVNFQAVQFGFDLSVHSCTKYLNGHSDIVAGAVIGSRSWIEKITHKQNHLGGSLDPHACFLLHRGMKTLALRMEQHNRSALALAQFLESHPKVEKVHYPGLAHHPDHARGKKLFSGFSGMLAFELAGDAEKADRFLSALRIPLVAPSLGGVESLITRPATTSHAGLSPDDRRKLGISDRLIRLSVGIEATEDLIEDFEQALDSIG